MPTVSQLVRMGREAELSKSKSPALQMSPAFGRSEGYTYKALGPMVSGDEVRAERAREGAGN